MKELNILVGPPAVGKSTMAANLIRGYRDSTILTAQYINQDSQGKNEHLNIFINSIKNGENVVVDRMNFDKQQRARYLKLAKLAGYKSKIIVLHESKETCFKRGMSRLVNEEHETIKTEQDLHKAVNFFFSHYERPTEDEADEIEFVYPKHTMKLKTIICDIDGTMANCEHRRVTKSDGKVDWKHFLLPENVEKDTLNQWCRTITHNLRNDHIIIMCSGRPDNLRQTTKQWLEKNQVYHDELFMRPRDDHRKDDIIKEIILDFEIKTRYSDVYFAIDDRQTIVDLWRKHGIVCLQCDKGDF